MLLTASLLISMLTLVRLITAAEPPQSLEIKLRPNLLNQLSRTRKWMDGLIQIGSQTKTQTDWEMESNPKNYWISNHRRSAQQQKEWTSQCQDGWIQMYLEANLQQTEWTALRTKESIQGKKECSPAESKSTTIWMDLCSARLKEERCFHGLRSEERQEEGRGGTRAHMLGCATIGVSEGYLDWISMSLIKFGNCKEIWL